MTWVFTSVSDPDSFFTDPDPGSGSSKKKLIFSKTITNFGRNFCFNPKSRDFIFVFNQSNTIGILLNKQLLFVSFLKISENHEKLVEKVDFYSSISLPGSGSGLAVWIRIHPDPDPKHWFSLMVFFYLAPLMFTVSPVVASNGAHQAVPHQLPHLTMLH